MQLKDEASPSKAAAGVLPAKKLIQKPVKGRLSQGLAQRAAAAGQRQGKTSKVHPLATPLKDQPGFGHPQQDVPAAPMGYHSFGAGPTGLGQPGVPQ